MARILKRFIRVVCKCEGARRKKNSTESRFYENLPKSGCRSVCRSRGWQIARVRKPPRSYRDHLIKERILCITPGSRRYLRPLCLLLITLPLTSRLLSSCTMPPTQLSDALSATLETHN